MRNLIIIILLFAVVLGGAWYLRRNLDQFGVDEPNNTESPTPNPTTTEDTTTTSPAPSDVASPNIRVTEPRPGAQIGDTFTVKGEARVFENVVSLRVKKNDGTVISATTTMANSPDTGQFGPFEIQFRIPGNISGDGVIEVYQASARDGSDTDLVSIPVVFR